MPLPLLALGLAGGQVAASFLGGRSARKAQKKARAIELAREEEARGQQRRQQIRQARVRRGQVEAASAASGVTGSSSETSALNSLTTSISVSSAFQQSQADAMNRQTQILQEGQNKVDKYGLASSLFGLAASADNAGLFGE